MAVHAHMIGLVATVCLTPICLLPPGNVQADPVKTQTEPEKKPTKDFLVASGLTKEAVSAITVVLQQNKIPFSTEELVGEGQRFEVTGDTAANRAFDLVKSLQPKLSKDALVIPDKLIGRTQSDNWAIGITYDPKAFEQICKFTNSRGLSPILPDGDGVAGYTLECKKEAGAASIAGLHDFAKLHPEIHLQIFDQPYPIYNYDEPVPSVNVVLH